MHTDSDVLAFIRDKAGSPSAAANALGLNSRQAFDIWCREDRGIPAYARGKVYRVATGLGARLPVAWALEARPYNGVKPKPPKRKRRGKGRGR